MIIENAFPKDWKWVNIGDVAEIKPNIPKTEMLYQMI